MCLPDCGVGQFSLDLDMPFIRVPASDAMVAPTPWWTMGQLVIFDFAGTGEFRSTRCARRCSFCIFEQVTYFWDRCEVLAVAAHGAMPGLLLLIRYLLLL